MRLFPEPGPSLPPFKTLLVHGTYHPSAPIHMCLSISPQDKAMLISPSRQLLLRSLRNYNDEWMDSNSGTGHVSSLSSRTTVFYPSSPKHLVALLSMLRTHDITTSSADPTATISSAPTLLVMYEPSAYFLPSNGNHPSQPASFVVFDSQIDRLKLPVLRTPKGVTEEPDGSNDTPGMESALFFARKYFDIVGTFQSRRDSPSPSTGARRCVFNLHKTGAECDSDTHWRWSEIPSMRSQYCDKNPTRFVWE
ncbi:hypothetical protein F5I97DRAFT_1804599 [Phlebopus sp. FC_14]|nr:hypothetical protein F5I97DRAFT_1804599 [Phlebopus sp. FC_14]